MPENLVVDARLASVVEMMLQRSGTFRRQCARIRGSPQLTVRIEQSRRLPSGMRAHTRMTRDGFRRAALIQIPALDDAVELIAHEMEHVIEQLDGIDLRSHAQRTHASVRAITADETTFETRRARQVGLLAAQEVRAWHSTAYSQLRR